MTAEELECVRRSYDAVAREYTVHLADELTGKPLDRAWLDRFAARMTAAGPVCDLGCGPGHVARYLRDAGADVFGLDLSPEMVAEASRLSPQISFREGNMLALDLESGSVAGIVAFYAIVNLSPADAGQALREMHRVLRAGGLLLLAFHVGDETVHRDELWGTPVDLDFRFFRPDEIGKALIESGFEIEESMERDPYPDVEYPSRRAYIMSRKPDACEIIGTVAIDTTGIIDQVQPLAVAEREIRRREQRDALREAAGSWKDEDHPELAEGADKWVRHMRYAAIQEK